ncbi:hypothetical protein D3C77_345280 [compost metagenome]
MFQSKHCLSLPVVLELLPICFLLHLPPTFGHAPAQAQCTVDTPNPMFIRQPRTALSLRIDDLHTVIRELDSIGIASQDSVIVTINLVETSGST